MSEGAREQDREAKFGGPPPPRTLAQRWVLATQGTLTELNATSHLRVGGEPRPSHSGLSAFRLRQHWGVRSPAEARERVRWLLAEGHRFGFARDTDRAAELYLGWDLVRAACVAGWSYVAYHLDLEEAWDTMLEAARALRAGFASWAEVGASYAAGKAAWSGGPSDDVTEATARLIAPGGGWDLPWGVDLTGDVAPPAADVLLELVVDPNGAAGTFKTIGEALGSSPKPKRVTVRAGTYDESVRVRAPLELVADGEVVIRNGKGAPLVLDHHAFVRGFRLEAGHDDAGQTMQGVWVGDNFARVVDCTITTERCGVYAGKKRAEVIVERCTVSRPKIHGMLIEHGAHMAILDAAVDEPAGSGVMTQGDGELYVAGLRISGAATPSLTFHGDNRVELHDVTVRGGASHAMQVLGGSVARVHGARFEGNAGVGALFASKAGTPSEIHGSVITGHAGNDLGVLSGGVSVHATKLGGGPACAVCVQNEGRLQLEGCEIAPTKFPLLWLMGASLTVLIDCKLRNESELALFADEGSSVRWASCSVATKTKTAVVLRGVRDALLVGGLIESADGCLHVDRESRVTARDLILHGSATGEDATATLAIAEGADFALVDGRVEAAGARAIAASSEAQASFTRTTVAAPAGVAFEVNDATVRLLGVEIAAKEACSLTGEALLSADADALVARHDGVTPLGLDAARCAPFRAALQRHGHATLEVELDAFRGALASVEVELDVDVAAAWASLATSSLKLATAYEIRPSSDGVAIESSDFADLHAIAAHLRTTFADPAALATLAEALRARIVAGEYDGEDEDGEEDEDEDEDEDEG